jgi:hypothetical protein
VTLVDSNRLGIASGCGAPSPAAVSTGIEWAIPLGDEMLAQTNGRAQLASPNIDLS